jgi:hypothetical protein
MPAAVAVVVAVAIQHHAAQVAQVAVVKVDSQLASQLVLLTPAVVAAVELEAVHRVDLEL